jgi:hypothetical protein
MKSLMSSLILFLAACGVCNAVEVLKQEPPLGTAAPGDKFLVDDGTCGRGRIKELTIGNWTKDMTPEQGAALRKRRCIARK